MSLEYKVPRLLWENLESVLLAQSKRYIGELARRLHVSEKELIKRVLPSSDSVKVMIQDTHAEHMMCKAYHQQDSMTIYCRKAVAYQSEFCPYHRNKRMTVIEGTHPIPIEKVKDQESKEPVWIHENHLLNSNGHIVGKINKEKQKLKWFIIDTA
jgi:hypothetical protein